jgi:ATP-binding cassette, subfamily C, bacterial
MNMSDHSSGLRLLIRFVRQFPQRTIILLGGMLLAAVAEGFGVATVLPMLSQVGDHAGKDPSFLNELVDSALSAIGLTPSVGLFLIILVVSLWLKGGLTFFVMRKVDYTVAQIATDIRLSLIRALMRARWGYYVSQPTGVLANAISNEAHRASAAYASACRMIAAGIEVGIYMVLALLVSWQVTLASAVAGGIIILTLGRLVNTMRQAGQQQAASFNALVSRLIDGLQGIKALKAMSREDALGPLLEAEANNLNRTMRQQAQSAEAMRTMQEPLLAIFLAVGLYVTLAVWNLPMELVLVMAFLFYRTVNRIGLLQAYYQGVAGMESFYHSINDRINEAEQAREPLHGMAAPTFSKAVEFDGVSFAYGDKTILDAIGLTIPSGKITVLAGHSGAGKTTISDLLLGLLRPHAGEIMVDGVPLGDINLKSWRQEIGYVPQEMFLFHESIRTNITLGEPDLTPEDVTEALRAAGAWDFVAALPDGIETLVGERGAKLSGGQRQRIAMARALVRRPKLLILDEPTTALDPKTEAAICSTLKMLGDEVTILAISHQTALMEIADVTYQIAEGGVEAGPSVPDPKSPILASN